jgi:SAM-dependent methyltransferase
MRFLLRYADRRRFEMTLACVRGRLLDVACGRNELVRMYGQGVGVDIYPWPGVDVLIQDAQALPFADKTFDTVSFVACLNHIPHRLEALKEARRVLADDGVLLATMIPDFVSRLWHLVNRPWDEDQTDRGMQEGEVYGLNFRQMTKLLDDAGFDLLEHRRFVLKLNVLYICAKRE